MTMTMTTTNSVWTYWEGNRNPLIDLCIETLRLHNPQFCLIDNATARELGAGEIIDAAWKHGAAHTSDILRCWVLHKFGGTWVDADLVCLRQFDLHERLQASQAEVLGFGVSLIDEHFSNIVFAAKQGATILADRVGEQLDILRKATKSKPLRYAAIGRPIPQQCRPTEDKRVVRICRQNFIPLNIKQAYQYFLRAEDKQHERADYYNSRAYCYHIWDRMARRYKTRSRDYILRDMTFLSFLFRKALSVQHASDRVFSASC